MTYDYHIVLGLIAAAVGFAGYIPYYRDILRGTTKPHPFTWLGFGLMIGITFVAQTLTGAGPGAWVNGVSALGVFGIAILSFSHGEKDISLFDWVCFASALLAILLWRLTSDPMWAVIIITVADAIAFAPTYRKGFLKPREETISLFVFSSVKYSISLFALTTLNVTTMLFPLSLVISNVGFVALLYIRRRQVRS